VTLWWNVTLPEQVFASLENVQVRFDTIVVDEAQDFALLSIETLKPLLDPDGPQRMLLLDDERQDLFGRGYVLPDA
jgi:superfamily I DNA/RNA helicase